jgi:uncharacterized membrane protein YbhN (UPF0104 family)
MTIGYPPGVRALRPDPSRMLVVAMLLAGGGIAFVVVSAGFDAVVSRFGDFRPAWLLLALGTQAIALAGYVLSYRRIVSMNGGPRLEVPLVIRLVATGFGALAPGGGFVIDYRALRSLGDSRSAAVRVLGLGALEYAVIAPAACVASAAMLLLGSDVHPAILWPWALAVPVGFVFVTWTAAPGRQEWIVGGKHGKGWRMLADLLAGIDLLRQMAVRPLRFAPAYVGVAVYWAAEIISLWAAIECVGSTLDAGPLIVGLATGYAMTRRSMPLGGAGATEVLLTFALFWAGLDLATAVAAMITYRFCSFVLPMLPGMWAHGEVVHLIEPDLAIEASHGFEPDSSTEESARRWLRTAPGAASASSMTNADQEKSRAPMPPPV